MASDTAHHRQPEIGHPAPDRGRVSLWLLFFGLVGAPIAWSLQLSAESSMAGVLCVKGDGMPNVADWVAFGRTSMIVVNLVAVAIALAALAASASAYRRIRSEAEGHHSGGVMDAGEGRTRFLSIWGIWTGVLFTLAILFTSATVLWVGLCTL